MNIQDLDKVEKSLDVDLPAYYRKAVTEGRVAGLLNADAQSVTAINIAFRNGEFGDKDWLSHVFAFAFADNGSGDFYCLDLSAQHSKVLIRDHETFERNQEADDFDEWLLSVQ